MARDDFSRELGRGVSRNIFETVLRTHLTLGFRHDVVRQFIIVRAFENESVSSSNEDLVDKTTVDKAHGLEYTSRDGRIE